MTQHSEECLPEAGSPAGDGTPTGARILPFERPQSDLQRAIQLRAQERLDRERERNREERRPQPLKWAIVFAIALIPVILIFGAVDGFLRAMQKVNEMNSSAPAATSAQPMPAEEEPPAVSQPGVVILQPYGAAPEAQSPPAQQGTDTNPDDRNPPPDPQR